MSEHTPIGQTGGEFDSNSAYLWDRSAPVDPLVQRLEATLGALAYRPAGPLAIRPREGRATTTRRWFAAAAALLVLVTGGWLLPRIGSVGVGPMPPAPPAVSPNDSLAWTVAPGTPEGTMSFIKSKSSRPGEWSGKLSVSGEKGTQAVEVRAGRGIRLLVAPSSSVRLSSKGAGESDASFLVEIEQGTVRFEAGSDSEPLKLLALDTGVRAMGTATLNLSVAGAAKSDDQLESGVVETTNGNAELVFNYRTTRMAAGERCRLHPINGPGLPRRETFKTDPKMLEIRSERLVELESALIGWSKRSVGDCLLNLLPLTTPEDLPLLWNLIYRTEGADRRQVVQHIADLLGKRKVSVPIEELMRADPAAMDELWNLAAP